MADNPAANADDLRAIVGGILAYLFACLLAFTAGYSAGLAAVEGSLLAR